MWNQWQVIYDENWTVEFRSIVRKRIPYSSDVAHETMDEVRQELAIKLSSLNEAPGAPNAYIRAAFRNTLEDYLRKQEGYPRPPEWIKRLGAAYERIYKLLCLENRAVNDIQGMMQNLYQYSYDFIERVIREVRAGVVNCGAWRDTVSIDLADDAFDNSDVTSTLTQGPDSVLEEMDTQAVIATILGQGSHVSVRTTRIRDMLGVLANCTISDDERLLLRLIHTDDCSVSEAARRIKLKDSDARKLLKEVYQRLKMALASAGLAEI
jgi:RNA polymerase sigma factor (sigma-70 family)